MPPLSPIELKFLKLYDEGKSYKEICVALNISLSTAKTHAKRILIKTMATCLRHAAYLRRKKEAEIPLPAITQLAVTAALGRMSVAA